MNEFWTILIAASPIVELRGAIPVAMGIFHFPWPKALFLSLIGNILPIIPIIWFLDKLSYYLSKKFSVFHHFFDWLFERTRTKTKNSFDKWGKWALVAFVAIPLPFTGVWTGSIAAFLFGVKYKNAFWIVSLGALLAGILVTCLTIFGIRTFASLRTLFLTLFEIRTFASLRTLFLTLFEIRTFASLRTLFLILFEINIFS